MKFCIIVPDGMGDYPVEQLQGKTPVEAARCPNIDFISMNGKLGLVRTVPEDLPPGSDVANLSVMGYNPTECYTGRAPLEAASLGIELEPDDVAFRCNLVTMDGDVLADYCAGHISSKEASVLIDLIQKRFGSSKIRFYAGSGFKNIMVYKGGGMDDVKTTPPHDIMGQEIGPHLPRGEGSQILRRIILGSRELLENHEINIVRTDLGENPANMIWLWGQGRRPTIEPFEQKYGIKGAVIAAVDLIKGLGKYLGWDIIEVPGATGEVDTNYAGKGEYAVRALEKYDLVFVHIEAPDMAGHDGDPLRKVLAIENIDEKVVAPILEALKKYDEFRVMVITDHLTPCELRTHTREPVPFAIYGEGVSSVRKVPFSEKNAQESDLKIDEGYMLMSHFLHLRE